MMNKVYLLGLFFLLGCSAQPEYYSHSQNVSLEGLPGYTHVFYQGEKLTPEPIQATSSHLPTQVENINQQEYKISRSWNNQELLIQKEGFKDYHLKLDSVLTSEAWASAEYDVDGDRHYFPLLGLLVPVKTIKEAVSIPTYLLLSVFSLVTFSPVDLTEYATKTGISLISLPKAIALDVYDIVSVPGTTIINPWVEFDYDSVIVLEPTEQLKHYCALQNNSFISNNGCLKCADSNIVLYSSKEECHKCSNRHWDNGQCRLD